MRKLETWKMILQSLESEIPVVLLYVVESRGSSPGRQGFMMAVNANRKMSGSIGGGIMEHKWVEFARESFIANGKNAQLQKQVHDKSAVKDRSGMICSGEQTIFIYPVQSRDLPAVREMTNSLESLGNGILTLGPGGISFRDEIPSRPFFYEYRSDKDWVYREKTGHAHHLSIVGGGHCSLALSRLGRELDFYIRVYDDRPGLSTMEENSWAHERKILGSYRELADQLPQVENHYVVIMTFGYRSDDAALRALKGMPFRYLGLLGSEKKISQMMATYREEGFPPGWLSSVHAPIGLNISSQTPEEIAVSIAAEIIRVKNKKTPGNEQN